MDSSIAVASVWALGVAGLGGAIGQGIAIASAVGGMTRNPGSKDATLPPMVLGLALIESIVVYPLVVCLMYYAKVR
jgi:F-type H+-transporting ATPase subunit c